MKFKTLWVLSFLPVISFSSQLCFSEVVTDIPTVAQAIAYQDAGWQCKPTGKADISPPETEYATICGRAADVDSHGWTNHWGNVYWAYMYQNDQCYFGRSCGGPMASCTSPGASRLFKYHRKKVSCTSPAGVVN